MIRRALQRNFTKVRSLENNKKGEVVDHLSTQFTVQYEGGKIHYLFYKDEGVTWRRQ